MSAHEYWPDENLDCYHCGEGPSNHAASAAMTPEDPRAALNERARNIARSLSRSCGVSNTQTGAITPADVDWLAFDIAAALRAARAEGFRAGVEAERKTAAEMTNWALDRLARLARDNAVAKPVATIAGGLHGYLAAPPPPLPEGW